MIADIIIGSLVVLVFSLMLYVIIKNRISFTRLVKEFVIVTMDKEKLIQRLSATTQELENAKLSDNNEFVKFLSDSREWAFEYIEEFQNIVRDIEKTYTTNDEVKRNSLVSKLILMLPSDDDSTEKLKGIL